HGPEARDEVPAREGGPVHAAVAAAEDVSRAVDRAHDDPLSLDVGAREDLAAERRIVDHAPVAAAVDALVDKAPEDPGDTKEVAVIAGARHERQRVGGIASDG